MINNTEVEGGGRGDRNSLGLKQHFHNIIFHTFRLRPTEV